LGEGIAGYDAAYMRSSPRLARWPWVASVAQIALLPAGCKTIQDRDREAVASAVASAVDGGTADGGRPASRGDGGGIGLRMGTTKPDDFPADIPIYPGSTVALGGRSTGPGKPSWSLTVKTDDSKDQAIARYQQVLGGFQKVTDLNMSDAVLSIWRSAAYDMTLMIGTAADGKTTITLNVASK